jgi:hypothetical protein
MSPDQYVALIDRVNVLQSILPARCPMPSGDKIVCTACPMCGAPAQAIESRTCGERPTTTYRYVDTHPPDSWEAWSQGALDAIAARVKRLEDSPIRVDKALDIFAADPHRPGARSCATCQTISVLLGHDFGCVKEMNDRQRKLARAKK